MNDVKCDIFVVLITVAAEIIIEKSSIFVW